MTNKFKSLSVGKKILLGLGAFTVVAGIIGAASSEPPKEIKTSNSAVKSESSQVEEPRPQVATKIVEETVEIPYRTTTQNDASMPSGETAIGVAGVNGKKVITYKLTYVDGVETKREPTSETVIQAPTDEVRKIGTKVAATPKPAANCHPSYSGACVPIASDVDCAGGSGNGPAYVNGPVYVTGSDPYDLDRDGDGVACE